MFFTRVSCKRIQIVKIEHAPKIMLPISCSSREPFLSDSLYPVTLCILELRATNTDKDENVSP